MAIYRGPGGAGDATGDATNASALALAAKDEAQASATAAANSATAAAASATSAANDAASASSSATSAAISRTAAAASATQAESVLSTAVKLTGDQTVAGVKTFSSTIAGSINGNAATVTNGVYTTGDQTIAGTKTFSSTIAGSINGNAATVTNGVYTTGDQTIAGTKTFLSTISGSINGNASTATSATTATTATNVSGGTASVTTLTTSSTVTHNGGTANRLTYLNGSKVLSTSDILVFDGANLGLNVTPPTSVSSSGGIYLASTANIAATGPYLHFGANYYYVLTTPKYTSTAPAAIYSSYNGTHLWRVAPSGTADATITWTTALTLDANADMYLPKNFYIGDASNTSSQVSSGSGSCPLIFGINGTEKARLDTTGNLGIGVTPSSWSSSYAKALQLGNKGAAVSGFTSSLSVIPYANVTNNSYYGSDATWKYYDGGYGASLYQQSANEHRWSVAGTGTTGSSITFTQAMTLNSSGNLGIGTASPSGKLHVAGAIYANDATSTSVFTNSGGAAVIGTTTNHPVGLWTNGTLRATLDSSGNLGLGVTPSAWSATYKALQVGGSVGLWGGASSELAILSSNAYLGGSGYARIIAGYATRYTQNVGTHSWSTAATSTSGSAITWTDAMTLDASGNLGVGITSPSAKLDVYQATQVNSTFRAYGPAGQILWANGGASTSYLDSDTIIFRKSSNSSNTETMRIDSSGNLLVGTTSADGVGVSITKTDGTIGRVSLNKSYSGNTDAVPCRYSGTYVGGMQYSNTAVAYLTSSDIRLKKDVVDAGSASERIEQIRIVSHGWKHDDATVEFGMIAQELFAVAPQAVTAGDDGDEIEQTWGIDYAKLVPMLIKAHQEQQAIIDSLKARLDAANL